MSYSGNYRMAGWYPQGPKVDSRTGVRLMQNRGVARANREAKREMAEFRNSRTPHTRRKAYRLGRCEGPCFTVA